MLSCRCRRIPDGESDEGDKVDADDGGRKVHFGSSSMASGDGRSDEAGGNMKEKLRGKREERRRGRGTDDGDLS